MYKEFKIQSWHNYQQADNSGQIVGMDKCDYLTKTQDLIEERTL